MKVLATFVALFGACAAVASASSVPVLLWGNFDHLTPVTAIHEYPLEEFANILATYQTPETTTVVFTEPNLSATDLSQHRGSFANLQRTPSKLYLSSVQTPLAAIQQRSVAATVQHLSADEALAGVPAATAAGSTVYVPLSEPQPAESRASLLQRHDAEIAAIVAQFAAGDASAAKPLFVYTGASPAASRQRRQTPPQTANTPTHFSDDHIMIYFTNVSYEGTPIKFTSMTTQLNGTNRIEVSLQGELPADKLVYVVATQNDWWTVIEAHFRGVLVYGTEHTVGASVGFSYHCSPTQAFVTENGKSYPLFLTGLQLEPDFRSPQAVGYKRRAAFSEPWDCVGFISPGMLGGFFVTLLLLVILSVGITWIMDIRTQDRFDDPKGKPIVVATTEG